MKQRFQEAGSGADFGLKFWVWATSSRSIFGDGGFGGVVGWGAVSEVVSGAVLESFSGAVLESVSGAVSWVVSEAVSGAVLGSISGDFSVVFSIGYYKTAVCTQCKSLKHERNN